MKKIFLAALTVLIYSINASAVLVQPARSNDVEDFELSLHLASQSNKYKKTWTKAKFARQKRAVALRQPAQAPVVALEPELLQKREVLAVEREAREYQNHAAPVGGISTISSSSP